jgi:hypothetical protein
VPAAQLGDHQARFRFPQEANDLFFGKSLLHVQSPVYGIGLQSYVLLKYGGTSRSHYSLAVDSRINVSVDGTGILNLGIGFGVAH